MPHGAALFGIFLYMTFKGDYAQGQGGSVRTSSGAGGRGGRRGGGPGGLLALPLLLGGGGSGVIILLLVLWLLLGGSGGGGGGTAPQGQGQQSGDYNLAHCDQPNASNEFDDCRIAATMTSLNNIWADLLPAQADVKFTKAELELFKGDVVTGCGYATGDTGPFYCPRDTTAYMDVAFFEALNQMGGSNGPLAQEYVAAHEYGHHIQQLEGTLGMSDYSNPGQDSAAVAIELQADCYAGLWAHHASQGENAALEPISDEQLREAVKTAQAIGDDHIQEQSGREVNPDVWTHGSSQQRMDAFLSGYNSGKMSSCDTLNRGAYRD